MVGEAIHCFTEWCQAHGWPDLLTRALVYAGVPLWLLIGAATFLAYAAMIGYSWSFGNEEEFRDLVLSGRKTLAHRRPPARWIVWMVLALLWAGLDLILLSQVGSDAGQAMPLSAIAFAAWTFGGAAGLGLLALALFIYGRWIAPHFGSTENTTEAKPKPPPRQAILTIIFLVVEAISAISALINALLKLRQRSGRFTTNETRRMNHLLAKNRQLESHAVFLGCKPGGVLDPSEDNSI
jgi:hypothetical protein